MVETASSWRPMATWASSARRPGGQRPTLLEVMIFLLLTPDVLWGGWLIASGWRGRPRLFANGLGRARRRSVADEIEEWLAAGGLP